PSSYTGKAYAQIMQKNLVADLGTNNLDIKARGDLAVLKKTKMPAVLAEVACMTDPGDLANLNTDEFIQKAAASLAKTIVQILNLQ
ncbi:MAG: N-acetylmuramoyl-L-alanine amidase, partial [Clostridia bacterium]|nr:N-acetylmuramoyl-L-alanine amidase [Clostridia bacterium]